MTDFRSLEELTVFRSDLPVATLRRIPKGCEFRYSDEFLRTDQPPIALHLPKTAESLTVEGLANLPTYFAGLLPEGIMYTAVKTVIGSAADDLFAVLAATGADAIGDIDVRIPGAEKSNATLDLSEAAALIDTLLKGEMPLPLDRLSAVPGVQPKLSIGEIVRTGRKTTYIAKFASPAFPGILENEFAFMRLAKRCGLDVAEVQLKPQALIVHRFDRRLEMPTKTLRKLHVEDMLQVMDLFPNSKYSMEYADLVAAMQRLGVSKATLMDALRLYLFSYLIGNGDLHAKNVSLLQDPENGQWRLTPAYDLLSTLPYPFPPQMALPLADEAVGRFTPDDFIQFGLHFSLPEKATRRMIARTTQALVKHLSTVPTSLTEPIRTRIDPFAK